MPSEDDGEYPREQHDEYHTAALDAGVCRRRTERGASRHASADNPGVTPAAISITSGLLSLIRQKLLLCFRTSRPGHLRFTAQTTAMSPSGRLPQEEHRI